MRLSAGNGLSKWRSMSTCSARSPGDRHGALARLAVALPRVVRADAGVRAGVRAMQVGVDVLPRRPAAPTGGSHARGRGRSRSGRRSSSCGRRSRAWPWDQCAPRPGPAERGPVDREPVRATASRAAWDGDDPRRHVRVDLRQLGRAVLPRRGQAALARALRRRTCRRVELNASHYRWPRDTAFAGWRDRLPAGFEMAVKAPRALTHARRLRRPRAVGRDHGARDAPARRPRGAAAAAAAADDGARRHPARPRPGRPAVLGPGRGRAAPPVLAGRRGLRAARAPGRGLRRHERGAPALRPAGDERAGLRAVARARATTTSTPGPTGRTTCSWWAQRLREWRSAGHRVRGYFNNDEHGYAVANAQRLTQLLGGDAPPRNLQPSIRDVAVRR